MCDVPVMCESMCWVWSRCGTPFARTEELPNPRNQRHVSPAACDKAWPAFLMTEGSQAERCGWDVELKPCGYALQDQLGSLGGAGVVGEVHEEGEVEAQAAAQVPTRVGLDHTLHSVRTRAKAPNAHTRTHDSPACTLTVMTAITKRAERTVRCVCAFVLM